MYLHRQESTYRTQDAGRQSSSVNSRTAQLQQHHQHKNQQPTASSWQYVQGPNGSYYAVISPAHDTGRQTQQQPQRSSVYTAHTTSGHTSTNRAGGSPAALYKPAPGRMMVSPAASASVSCLPSQHVLNMFLMVPCRCVRTDTQCSACLALMRYSKRGAMVALALMIDMHIRGSGRPRAM